jgi:hypothetical protein
VYESYRSAHHEREDVDMTERELNAFDKEPLYDAWISEMQMGEYGLMSKEQFYELLGNRGTIPDRLAKGVGRDLMRAVAYAIHHVKLARDAAPVTTGIDERPMNAPPLPPRLRKKKSES